MRKGLGFGRVLPVTRENPDTGKIQTFSKYTVKDKEGLQKIMVLFNGNLVLPKRYSQFSGWVNAGKNLWPVGFSLKEHRVQVSLANGWFSGFLEAEGSFYSDSRSSLQYPAIYTLRQKVTLTQKDTHGESVILKQISDLFESAGKLHVVKKPDCFCIEIHALKSHTILVSYLKQFSLLGKKNGAFHRWRDLYLRRLAPNARKKGKDTLENITEIKKLCFEINNFETED